MMSDKRWKQIRERSKLLIKPGCVQHDCAECKKTAKRIAALKSSNAALQHDITRAVERNTEIVNENEALRKTILNIQAYVNYQIQQQEVIDAAKERNHA